MRRIGALLLFLLVLGAPFALRLAIGVSQPLRAGGDSERLVILTPNAESIRTEFADAFSDWHRERFGTPVEIDYRALSANEITRYLAAGRETIFAKLGTYKVDLVWGGGDYLFDHDLKGGGYLEPARLDPAILTAAFPSRELAGLPLYDRDPNPTWFGTALSSFGIVYNKDVLRYLGLPEPRTWADLADPRYRGWIVLADPTRSGVARAVFMVIVERAMADAAERGEREDLGFARGMGLIRLISSNARIFQDAGSAIAGWVGTGDVAAGTAIDFQARSQISDVGEARLGYVEPAGATAINPDPIAMVKGAPHRDVAQRFIEFVLSEPGQRLWITRAGTPGGPKRDSLRRLPIMPSVYERPANFTETVNPFQAAGGFNTSAARRRTMLILGDLIEASCMDKLDDLRAARAAVVNAPDLESRLATFPFDQKAALALADRWRKLPTLERLREKRHLRDRFAAEYRDLREKAQAADVR